MSRSPKCYIVWPLNHITGHTLYKFLGYAPAVSEAPNRSKLFTDVYDTYISPLGTVGHS